MAVTIKYLSNTLTSEDLVGALVETARQRLRSAFSMPQDVSAYIDGEMVDNTDLLEDGDQLEFRKTHGEKGNNN